jgi:hypothetical protein
MQTEKCTTSDLIPNVVFNMTSTNMDNSDLQNTMSINDSLYIHDSENYSILEHHDITTMIHKVPFLQLTQNVVTKKITLLNFPMNQYILNLNSNNSATATLEIVDDQHNYVFDFANKQSTTLKNMIIVTTYDKPRIENRSHYVDLSRMDNVKINCDMDKLVNDKYHIKIEGYWKIGDEWIYDTKIINVYPHNTYSISINHPTDTIDLYHMIKLNHEKDAYGILVIDGKEYCKFTVDSNTNSYCTRIKCKNLPTISFAIGAQNRLLSENINANTINFSRVDKIELILVNCVYSQVYQNVYIAYSYPHRVTRYAK